MSSERLQYDLLTTTANLFGENVLIERTMYGLVRASCKYGLPVKVLVPRIEQV